MNTRTLVICLLAVLLAGCASAARNVANQGDDVVRLIGDDIARIASNNGDEIARTAQQYADDVPRQAQYSDEAARYWDDVLRSSQSVDDQARLLLYRSENLSPLQADFVTWLRSEANLSESESLLYLQTVCSVANYVQYYNEYPSQSSTQFYAEQVAGQNGILLFSIADFAESVLNFTAGLIENNGTYSRQEAASLLFEGLCLISDAAGN